MKGLYLLILLLTIRSTGFSQDMNYYFDDHNFDASIPTPSEVLGFNVGEFHLSHDQIVLYLDKLSRLSDRVKMVEYARSHEKRPLVVLYISSRENLEEMGEILDNKKTLFEAETVESYKTDMPSVLYQGFSIHGDEASGSNAAVLYAYYLAASKEKEVKDKLEKSVVLLDPCMNPDGVQRFSTWVNSNKSAELVSDPSAREFNQVWPRGRTNHYWFDLNRDWLLVQHPESQGRVKLFHDWKPVILTDHHEMGSHSTFFFQPGIPSRVYPGTPKKNQELCLDISRYHEHELDKVKSLYYSHESFDDFYIGKGSTYPDVNGCIGILFEQGSARGHSQETHYGIKTFPFAVKNQLLTAISTLTAGAEMRKELNEYQKDFYKNHLNDASIKSKSLVVQSGDPEMLEEFKRILGHHRIDFQALAQSTTVNGESYAQGYSLVIPLEQGNTGLLQAMFDERKKFSDSLFYDVSAWNLGHALNLNYSFTKQALKTNVPSSASYSVGQADYAYSYTLQNSRAYGLTLALLENGVRCILTNAEHISKSKRFKNSKGSVIVSLENQDLSDIELYKLFQDESKNHRVKINSHSSGAKSDGVNFGSPSHKLLRQPEVAMLVGQPARAYDAGEIWHLFDQKLSYPISLVDVRTLGKNTLGRYNTLLLVDGFYSEETAKKIKSWASRDKVIIAMRRANSWLKENEILKFQVSESFKKEKDDNESEPDVVQRPYASANADNGAKYLGGAIFKTNLDLSHPLNYGYRNSELAIFKKSNLHFSELKNAYSSPAHLTANSLLAGYAPRNYEKNMSGKPTVVVSNFKGARVISFSDIPVFRSYFRGTERQLLNAILLGNTLSSNTCE